MCRLGCILGTDVNATPYIESFVANSAGNNYWTPSGVYAAGYANGDYQYHLIFETFSDSSIADKIYFGAKNESTGASYYFQLTTEDIGAGDPNNKVWDDIRFNLVGETNGGIGKSAPGVMVVGSEQSQRQSYITVYNRTDTPVAPDVPEPSAFGLLAGMGALALVASRRRRK